MKSHNWCNEKVQREVKVHQDGKNVCEGGACTHVDHIQIAGYSLGKYSSNHFEEMDISMLDALAMLNSYLACRNRGTHVNPFNH